MPHQQPRFWDPVDGQTTHPHNWRLVLWWQWQWPSKGAPSVTRIWAKAKEKPKNWCKNCLIIRKYDNYVYWVYWLLCIRGGKPQVLCGKHAVGIVILRPSDGRIHDSSNWSTFGIHSRAMPKSIGCNQTPNIRRSNPWDFFESEEPEKSCTDWVDIRIFGTDVHDIIILPVMWEAGSSSFLDSSWVTPLETSWETKSGST